MRYAATAATVAALAVLAGCGGSSNGSTANSSTASSSTANAAGKSLLAGASPEVVLGVNLIVDRESQSKLAETGMEAVHNMIAKRDQPRTIASMLDASKGHLRRAEADQAQLEKLGGQTVNRAELIWRAER
jgi:hypothetical protein